jgi:hypothetical protein
MRALACPKCGCPATPQPVHCPDCESVLPPGHDGPCPECGSPPPEVEESRSIPRPDLQAIAAAPVAVVPESQTSELEEMGRGYLKGLPDSFQISIEMNKDSFIEKALFSRSLTHVANFELFSEEGSGCRHYSCGVSKSSFGGTLKHLGQMFWLIEVRPHASSGHAIYIKAHKRMGSTTRMFHAIWYYTDQTLHVLSSNASRNRVTTLPQALETCTKVFVDRYLHRLSWN